MLYDENYFDKMVPRENEYRKKKPKESRGKTFVSLNSIR